jgi:hypothetical protein
MRPPRGYHGATAFWSAAVLRRFSEPTSKASRAQLHAKDASVGISHPDRSCIRFNLKTAMRMNSQDAKAEGLKINGATLKP